MIEPLFGSGAPMWTAVPPAAFPFQSPIASAATPIATPLFGAANLSGLAAGVPGIAPSLPGPTALPSPVYGYSALPPQSLGAAVYPFTRTTAFGGPEWVGGLTAPALLAAVAARRGQPQGPTNDQEVEDFIYDALDLLTGAADVEVRSDAGRVTLTGSVQHKRSKRDVGEIAWAIPGVQDVQNNVTIASRRRTRTGGREGELAASAQTRKQT